VIHETLDRAKERREALEDTAKETGEQKSLKRPSHMGEGRFGLQ